MAAKEYSKGKIIISEGQPLDTVYIIAQGSVNASFPGGEIVLKKGDIIGLSDIFYDSSFFTYTALENTTVLPLVISTKTAFRDVIKSNPEVAKMVCTSMVNQALLIFSHYARMKKSCVAVYTSIMSFYDKYVGLCSKNVITARSLPQLDEFSEFNPENAVEDWIVSYYASIRNLSPEVRQSAALEASFLVGFANKTSEDIHSAFSACEEMNDYISENLTLLCQENQMDIFDLLSALLFRLKEGTPDFDETKATIEEIIEFLKKEPLANQIVLRDRVSDYRIKLQGYSGNTAEEAGGSKTGDNYSKELQNSLDTILEYSGVDDSVASAFRKAVTQYKKLSDKASTDDSARKLRLEITKLFNQIYSEAFRASVRDYSVPTIMKMFFNFGYVDEELAGADNASYLYTLADNYCGDETYGVYTLYEWLKQIYDLNKDPSRNEFDVDYLSHIHEQKVTGKITAEMENTLANSASDRVNYELENMFPTVNKVTFGRISAFCPVFSDSNIIKPLPSCLVTVDTIIDALKKVNDVDYGAFFRETVYTNERAGIPKEYIAVKILPDVILFPNIGTRGVMWQEIEGRKRTTPARFMISAFHLEDVNLTFTRLVGEYRWEMCKRVQGARWNDVTDRSLTSEYFDYVQFYKKNSELSQDAKEKVKASLAKAKNSFKEMFVRDYITWVLFEGTGSPRLNKIARQIMCTYCPFPYELRQKVAANPMFKELIEHYEIKVSQKVHHYENVMTKMKNAGTPIPNELLVHMNFIQGK